MLLQYFPKHQVLSLVVVIFEKNNKQSNKEQPAAERFPQQTYLRPQTFRQKKRN